MLANMHFCQRHPDWKRRDVSILIIFIDFSAYFVKCVTEESAVSYSFLSQKHKPPKISIFGRHCYAHLVGPLGPRTAWAGSSFCQRVLVLPDRGWMEHVLEQFHFYKTNRTHRGKSLELFLVILDEFLVLLVPCSSSWNQTNESLQIIQIDSIHHFSRFVSMPPQRLGSFVTAGRLSRLPADVIKVVKVASDGLTLIQGCQIPWPLTYEPSEPNSRDNTYTKVYYTYMQGQRQFLKERKKLVVYKKGSIYIYIYIYL